MEYSYFFTPSQLQRNWHVFLYCRMTGQLAFSEQYAQTMKITFHMVLMWQLLLWQVLACKAGNLAVCPFMFGPPMLGIVLHVNSGLCPVALHTFLYRVLLFIRVRLWGNHEIWSFLRWLRHCRLFLLCRPSPPWARYWSNATPQRYQVCTDT